MKTILRYIVFYTFALYIVSQLFSGLVIHGGIKTLFLAGVIFAGLNLIIKPLLNAISFPLLIITLGLFSFAINAGILFLLTKFISDVQVHSFTIQKIAYNQYAVPKTTVNIFFAYIVLSAIIAFLTLVFRWISE